MLLNALKIALRSLSKHRGYSFINIAGLAVGLACCLLIALYVADELSYDRYNEKADRIYKVVMESRTPEKESAYALSPAPLGAALVRDFPEVELSTRLFTFFGNVDVAEGQQRFMESRIFFADSTFFDVFSVPLVSGDRHSALSKPNTIVLSRTMARKYFGSGDPIGKGLKLNSDFDVEVTAVMEDIPSRTHFHADALISLASTGFSRNPSFISNNNFHTYIILREGARPRDLEAKFPAAIRKYSAGQIAERYGQTYDERVAGGFSTRWSLVPLTDIHLYSHREYEIEANGDIATVYMFSIVAGIVLLIACVNFVNLTTARSAGRAKEIGVRKVAGSNRAQLMGQFVIESLVLTILALLIAVALTEFLLPAFNTLSGKQIDAGFLMHIPWLLSLFGGAVLVGVIAGLYPAVFLSSLRPIVMLKGGVSANGRAPRVRSGLVVFQFAVSVALIAGTIVVQRQLEFVSNRNLGFEKERVLIIAHAQSIGQQREVFVRELSGNPNIISVGASTTLPEKLFGRSSYRDIHSTTSYALHEMDVDQGFIPTMQIKLVAGRNFSAAIASDSSAVILNQAAAKLFGWVDPVGHQLAYPGESERWRGTVVGVVKDFNFESLHTKIQPLVVLYQPAYQYLSVRLRPEHIQASVQFIESVWKKLAPQQPFQFSFLDRDFDSLYHAEHQTGIVFGIFSALAIFIASLGQLGLVAFMIDKRTKEIGVRKVLGASVPGIVRLLSWDSVKLVLIANVLAWPVTYAVMSRWLDQFAYRIEVGWWILALAGVLALMIALATVVLQAIRAAAADPVEALRYE